MSQEVNDTEKKRNGWTRKARENKGFMLPSVLIMFWWEFTEAIVGVLF